jgi:hypothetical protein
MRITLVYIRVRCGQPEGPEGNMSRYTMRPGTHGSTLEDEQLQNLSALGLSLDRSCGAIPKVRIKRRLVTEGRTLAYLLNDTRAHIHLP